MARELPPFDTVTQKELRVLWRQHDDPDIHLLILEVVRYRQVIKEICTVMCQLCS